MEYGQNPAAQITTPDQPVWLRSVLAKFVKNITIQEYYCVLHANHFVNDVHQLIGYFSSDALGNLLVAGSKKEKNGADLGNIRVTDHAFNRWKERVSNVSLSLPQLQNLLNLLHHFGRIEFQPNGVGIIDSEILFIYTYSDRDIIIPTFYGRFSQIPALHQFEALRNFNQHADEYVGLSLNAELLGRLPIPPVPAIRMVFRGNTTTYLLEKYTDERDALFVLTVIDGPGAGVVREFLSTQYQCERLEKSVRRALLILGEHEFVFHHIAFHYPEELKRRIQRAKERNEKTP
jgi:hypothetical protein